MTAEPEEKPTQKPAPTASLDRTGGLDATVVQERVAGEKSFGRFRDLRLLGAGGMGEINPDPGPDIVVLTGLVDLVEARHRAARGQPVEPALRSATASFRRAQARDPKLASARRRLEEAERLATAAARREVR